MPTGRAVMKLPEITRTVEPAIGVFGRPWLKRGLDLVAQLAGGFLGAVERHLVGDAHAVRVARRVALGRSCSLTCGRKPCTSTTLMPMLLDQRQVLREVLQLAGRDRLAGDADHEGLAAVRVDVGRHRAEPGDEGEVEDGGHARRRMCRMVQRNGRRGRRPG